MSTRGQVLLGANMKGGTGKTTVMYAVTVGAAAEGMNVLVIDLDPQGGMSKTLERARVANRTIAHVIRDLDGGGDALTPLRAAVPHPFGVHVIAGHSSLAENPPSGDTLARILRPCVREYDLVILDTHPLRPQIIGPMQVAHRIIIPSMLEQAPFARTIMTIAFAHTLAALGRVMGVALTRVEQFQFMSQARKGMYRSYMDDQGTGDPGQALAFTSVLRQSEKWDMALTGRELPPPELMAEARALVAEVLARSCPREALIAFLEFNNHARAHGSAAAAGGG